MKLRLVAVVAALLALAAAAACSDDSDGSSFANGTDGGGADSSGVYPPTDAAVGAASGVVILHAAAFPPFRLCFENYPNLPPQPNMAPMPNANVVGVEVGSAVRIPALPKAPGKIFVLNQRKVSATPGDPKARTCGQLIGDDEFQLNFEYQVGGEVDEPLGVDHVDVLAITGCGGGAWLQALGLSPDGCTDWSETNGSLKARTIALYPTVQATARSVPVQLVHMSALLEQRRAQGDEVEVSFGAFAADGGPGHRVTVPPLFEAGAPTTLMLDQADETVFASHGFRIAVRADAGAPDAGPTFVVDQSLAEVQELSFPQTVPTTYYLAASNYALLLLGDPNVTRTLDDGGRNPSFDARRALHLLAVPVKEESDAAAELDPAGDASIVPRVDGG